jgi:hypothetical protein
MARTVTSPSGETWRVRRLWAPRLQGESLLRRAWRRVRGTVRRSGDLADVPDAGCAIDLADELAIALIAIVAVLVLVFFVVPLLVALVDLVILVVLTLLGIVARVLFRRPWVVEATAPDGSRLRWRIVGWRASREAVDEIADALAHGHPPPPGHAPSPRPGPAPADS